jgi:hypothetical protein
MSSRFAVSPLAHLRPALAGGLAAALCLAWLTPARAAEPEPFDTTQPTDAATQPTDAASAHVRFVFTRRVQSLTVLNGKGETTAYCTDTCAVALAPARYTVQVSARGRDMRDVGLTVTRDAEYRLSVPAPAKGTSIAGGVIIGMSTLIGLAVQSVENIELCLDNEECSDRENTYFGTGILVSGVALGTALIVGGRQPARPTLRPLKMEAHPKESERAAVSLRIGRLPGGAVLSLSGRF